MVVKDGQALLEHYDLGLSPETRWMSMSMAKSVATTLVGCAIKDGFIQNVDELLVTYLPQLRGGGYEPVSIRHLMQMTSGVDWDDTHTDAASHRRHMLALQVAQKGGAILDYMADRSSIAEPGERWNYSTGETHVVGALLKAATGKWLSDYFSEKIWSRIGTEHDAAWWLESPNGLEVAGSGICATMRDYCRFGLFALSGMTLDGEMVVPDDWFREATSIRAAGDDSLPYGYMWWPVPNREGSFDDGAFSARGIFGQYIYINPARNIVITTLSARAKPRYAEVILDNDFFNAVVADIG
nr:serine hydrolase [Pacificimonas pallii]